MSSTQFQTAIATIATAIALVVLAVPNADAAPNTGKYQSSAEAKRAKQQLCADLKLIMESSQDEAKAAWEAGDAAATTEADATATKAYTDARRQGCGWAARVVLPSSAQTLGTAAPPMATAP